MKTLEQQYEEQYGGCNVLLPKREGRLIDRMIAACGIEERGGGPEGIYYTHPLVEGEYLLCNVPVLIQDLIKRYQTELNILFQ